MKKYTYPSVTGEASEIEVTGEWAEILAQADKDEYNNHQTETRRHVSLEEFYHDGDLVFASPDDVEKEVIFNADKARLYGAIQSLCESQRDLIYSIYFLGMRSHEYAQARNMGKTAVSMLKHRAILNLKKFFLKKA